MKQLSTLLVATSMCNAEAASGLANDLAFITIHLGIILGRGGPVLESLTVIKLDKLDLCLSVCRMHVQYGYCSGKKSREAFRKKL